MSDDNFSKTVIAAREMFGSLKRNIVMEPTVFADADLPWYQPLADLKPYAALVAQDEYIGTGQNGLAPWSPNEYGQMVQYIKPIETQTSAAVFTDIQRISGAARRGPIFDGQKIRLNKPSLDDNPYLNSGLYMTSQFPNYIQQEMWYKRKFSLFVKMTDVTSGGHVFGGLNNVAVNSYRLEFDFNNQRLIFHIGNAGDPYGRISAVFYLNSPWQGFAVAVVSEDMVTLYADDDVYTFDLTINKFHSRRYYQAAAQSWILGHDVNGGNPINANVYSAAIFDRGLTAEEAAKLRTMESDQVVRRKATPFDAYEVDYPRMFAWIPENNLYLDQPYSSIPAPWTATNGAWAINATYTRNPTVQVTGNLKFDGVNDRLYLSNLNPNTCAPKRTMVIRARNMDGGTILSTGGTNEEFYIRFPNNDTVEFHYNHATEGVGVLSGAASDDSFHVIAVVIDETEMRLYVDGVLQDSVSGASWHFNTGNKRTTLGARYNGASVTQETDFFEGIISHLVIVDNDAMTPSEIVDISALMVPELGPIQTQALPPFVYHEYDVLKLTGLSEGDWGEVLPDTKNGFDLQSIFSSNNDIYKPIYRENAGDYGYPALEFWGASNRLMRQGFVGSPIVGESFTIMMLWRKISNTDGYYWSGQSSYTNSSFTKKDLGSYYAVDYPGTAYLNFGKPFEEDAHLQTWFASKADARIKLGINFDQLREVGLNPLNGFTNSTDIMGIGSVGVYSPATNSYLYGCWIIPGELTEQQYQEMREYIKARFPKLWEGNIYV